MSEEQTVETNEIAYEDRPIEEVESLRETITKSSFGGYAYTAEPAPGADVHGIWHCFHTDSRAGYAAHAVAASWMIREEMKAPLMLIPHRVKDIDIDNFPADREEMLLRWLGHRPVAVLDGGFAAWINAGGALETGATILRPALAPYPATAPAMPTVSADDLLPGRQRLLVIDARAGERFRGEVEPLDRVAGHIPGARNRFFKDNLAPDGRFKPVSELRAAFEAFGVAPEAVVQQCGSGVTACHNLLAMTHAGLPGSRLYAGSWSEWSADPARPVARG
jgi:rhodanese-related sulfurtransferase